MSWFSFFSTLSSSGEIVTQTPVQKYPPVRRKINFPVLKENIKVGDWIYVSLSDLEVGRVYSTNNTGIVSSLADNYSYLVVYENQSTYQPTYSYIDSQNNLYFKSVSQTSAGEVLTGSYYVYYHYKNIQQIFLVSNKYVQSEISVNGFNAFDDGTGTTSTNVDKYSNLVLGNSANERISSLSYISSPGIWVNQESDNPGNKVVGTFDGPLLKIYGTKSPESGKVSIKIIKTSSTGLGQSVIKNDIIDLYNPSTSEDTQIYSLDISAQTSLNDLTEIYNSFMFEIEILNDKNISSSGKKIKITKYAFSKNHSLSISDEEIYEGITFISSGVIR